MSKKAHWLLSPVISSYGLWATQALWFSEETEITITKEWFQLKLSGEKQSGSAPTVKWFQLFGSAFGQNPLCVCLCVAMKFSTFLIWEGVAYAICWWKLCTT